MKLSRWLCAVLIAMSLPGLALAKEKDKDKAKDSDAKGVDSGSFGVFVKGHRVGTETFSVTQNANGSIIHSVFKAEGEAGQAVQESELQLTSNGEIRRYDWKEQSPGKAHSSVLPNDQFVTQQWTAGPQDKDHEQPYLLPTATSILDDYFFVHREVLAWKYLAGACTREAAGMRCPKAQFGTLNPSQHSSAPASMEYLGHDKVKIHDAERDLNKLELKSDAGSWTIWLDDQFKVQLISIPDESTEVIRD